VDTHYLLELDSLNPVPTKTGFSEYSKKWNHKQVRLTVQKGDSRRQKGDSRRQKGDSRRQKKQEAEAYDDDMTLTLEQLLKFTLLLVKNTFWAVFNSLDPVNPVPTKTGFSGYTPFNFVVTLVLGEEHILSCF
jgi:hypothetical protein